MQTAATQRERRAMPRTKTTPYRNDGHGMASEARQTAYARSVRTPAHTKRGDEDSRPHKRSKITHGSDVQEEDVSSQIISDTQTMQQLLEQLSCITAHLNRLEDDTDDDAWKEYCANGCNVLKSKTQEIARLVAMWNDMTEDAREFELALKKAGQGHVVAKLYQEQCAKDHADDDPEEIRKVDDLLNAQHTQIEQTEDASNSAPLDDQRAVDEAGVDVIDPTAQPLWADTEDAQINTFDKTLETVVAATAGPVWNHNERVNASLHELLEDFQLEAVSLASRHVRNEEGFMISLPPGHGKTLITLTTISMVGCHALVICPKTIVGVWTHEAQKFKDQLGITCIPYHKDLVDSLANLAKTPSNVIVMSHDTFKTDGTLVEQLYKDTKLVLVVDEAHQMKNVTTTLAKQVRYVEATKLFVTGTPLQNNLTEYHQLLDSIREGVLGAADAFRAHLGKRIIHGLVLGATFNEARAGRTSILALQNLTSECLFCQDSLQAVPPNETFIVAFPDFDTRDVEFSPNLFTYKSRLYPAMRDTKVIQISLLIHSIWEHDPDGNIVLFSCSNALLNAMQEAYPDRLKVIQGETSNQDRDRYARFFAGDQDDCKGHILALQTKVACGLNLAAAKYAIVADPSENPTFDQQAVARIQRMSSNFDGTTVLFLRSSKLERGIMRLADSKTELASSILSTQQSKDILVNSIMDLAENEETNVVVDSKELQESYLGFDLNDVLGDLGVTVYKKPPPKYAHIDQFDELLSKNEENRLAIALDLPRRLVPPGADQTEAQLLESHAVYFQAPYNHKLVPAYPLAFSLETTYYQDTKTFRVRFEKMFPCGWHELVVYKLQFQRNDKGMWHDFSNEWIDSFDKNPSLPFVMQNAEIEDVFYFRVMYSNDGKVWQTSEPSAPCSPMFFLDA